MIYEITDLEAKVICSALASHLRQCREYKESFGHTFTDDESEWVDFKVASMNSLIKKFKSKEKESKNGD